MERLKEWELAYKPGSVKNSHSSGMYVTVHLMQPTRELVRTTRYAPCGTNIPLFGLAPGGVYHAVECCHRRGALLPHPFTLTQPMAGRSTLCCTGRRLAPPRRYLAPCPMEPGLSSFPHINAETRLPGRLPQLLSSTSYLIDRVIID